MFNAGQKVFLVGIGGIGVSGLARLLQARGLGVSGADLAPSEITEALQKAGMAVKIGHQAANLPKDLDYLIYSLAVPEENPERNEARQRGTRALSYPEALKELVKDKRLIAIAGTNGKTTVTAMTGLILEKAGLDPSVLVGGQVFAWNSNVRFGRGEWFVLEADEYRRAFLNYDPEIAAIVNIQADHLDYYRDLEDVSRAFAEFAGRIQPGGRFVYNRDDENTAAVAAGVTAKKISFGLHQDSDLSPASLPGLNLRVPGRHNLENALCAAAIGKALALPVKQIVAGLNEFWGTWRRLELVGRAGRTEVYSDYAHHPAGVGVTLETLAGMYPPRKILAVFQPHQYNRTKRLFEDFVRVFCQSQLRDFIFPEIFEVAGREGAADQDISSEDLAREIAKCGKQAVYAPDLAVCEEEVRKVVKNYDAVIFMGAGDIYLVAKQLIDEKAAPVRK